MWKLSESGPPLSPGNVEWECRMGTLLTSWNKSLAFPKFDQSLELFHLGNDVP
jgi:hypothetical protein